MGRPERISSPNEKVIRYRLDNFGTDIIEYIPVFHYHKLLLNFLENSKYSCDRITFELFCQMNPGYKFFSVTRPEDTNMLVQLHDKYLKDFWKFNVYSRVMELIQTYTDNLFSVKRSMIGTPSIQLQSMKLKRAIMVPKELYEKIEIFIRYVDDKRDVIRNVSGFKQIEGWHAEVFDNHIKDIRSYCAMCIDTDIATNRKGDFLPITDYMYMRIIKWLVERCDNSHSEFYKDTDQFFNMLYVFVYMHHLHYLCGSENNVRPSWNIKDPKQMWEEYEESKYPYKAFQDSRKDNSRRGGGYFYGNNTMQDDSYRAIEEKMYFYGHLTQANCLCTRPGIYPTMNNKRTANLDIIQFLSLQEFFFSPYSSER